MSTDLAPWLLEQIAADEAVARAAKPGPWFANGADNSPDWWDWQVGTGTGVIGRTETFPGVDVRGDVVWSGYEGGGTDRPNATHITTWDPARVLAECDAKRRIVEPWTDSRTDEDNWRYGIHAEAHQHVLRLLALPYADRPGYRKEWKP